MNTLLTYIQFEIISGMDSQNDESLILSLASILGLVSIVFFITAIAAGGLCYRLFLQGKKYTRYRMGNYVILFV